MNLVYIVTSGEYSDYGIRAVFDNEATAQRWIDGEGFNEAQIEIYYVLTERRMVHEHTIDLHWDGREKVRRDGSQVTTITQPSDEEDVNGQAPVRPSTLQYGGWTGVVSASARTPERARKIAQDKAAELKAQDAGLT